MVRSYTKMLCLMCIVGILGGCASQADPVVRAGDGKPEKLDDRDWEKAAGIS